MKRRGFQTLGTQLPSWASWFAVPALALGLLLLGGCRQDTPTDRPTLRVGGILSKSGPAAAYGGDADNGVWLALQEVEKRSLPFAVEYTSTDDKSDKTEAAKLARNLIEATGVQVIVGPATSPAALSVGKLADERSIPVVATSPTLDEVTVSDTYDRKYVFRVCFNDSFQGGVLARFVATTLHKSRAVVVLDKALAYSIGLAKTFRGEFQRLGGTIVAEESYSVKDTDYSALITKIATYDADVLFIPGWDENVGPMMKQAAGRWNKFVAVGGDGWPTNQFLALAGNNLPESYALSHFIVDDPAPKVVAFRNAYRQRFGADPTAFSALGYDAFMLAVDAAARAKRLNPTAIRDALEGTADFEGVTGKIHFDANRNPQKEGVIVRVTPAGFQFYERVLPASANR